MTNDNKKYFGIHARALYNIRKHASWKLTKMRITNHRHSLYSIIAYNKELSIGVLEAITKSLIKYDIHMSDYTEILCQLDALELKINTSSFIRDYDNLVILMKNAHMTGDY